MRQLAPGAFFPFDVDLLDRRGQWANDVGTDVSTIRKYGAKYGRGVAVEPGVTNLLVHNDWDTKLGGFNSTHGHRPADVTNQFDGWRRVPKIDGLGVANTEAYVNQTYAVTNGQRYTQQFLFRFDGTRPTIAIVFDTNGTDSGNLSPTLTDLGGGVWHAMAAYVIAGGGSLSRAFECVVTDWGTSTYIEFLEPSLHLHTGVQAAVTAPVRTSHVWGTRAAGILKYQGHILPRRAGTISCWFRPNFDLIAFASADDRGLIGSHTSGAEFQLWIKDKIYIDTYFGTAIQLTLNYAPGALSPTALHHVAFTWSDTEQVLYYNGVRRATHTGTFTRWTDSTWVSVAGLRATANDWLDGLIDDLAIIPRQLTDAQVAAIYGG